MKKNENETFKMHDLIESKDSEKETDIDDDEEEDQINLLEKRIKSSIELRQQQQQDTAKKKKQKRIKSALLSICSILLYYFFSISLTFYNRYLFVTYKYPLSITIIHLIVKFLLSFAIRLVLNLTVNRSKKRITLDWYTYFTRIIPTAVASAADIGLSNWSLQYITITLYTMAKSTVILFIFFFSILFKLEKWVFFCVCIF
jgi:hypothetical protein